MTSITMPVFSMALMLGVARAQTSPRCQVASDCVSCLGGSFGTACGWCAVNTTSATAVGPQCVDLHSTFDCNIQFQTEHCTAGYTCKKSGNNSQCVPAAGGIASKSECEKRCKALPADSRSVPLSL